MTGPKKSNELSPEGLKSRIKNFVLQKIKSQQSNNLNKSSFGANKERQSLELKKLSNNRRSTVLKAKNEADQPGQFTQDHHSPKVDEQYYAQMENIQAT